MSPRGTICPVILLTVLLWPVSPCAAQIENPVYVDDSPQAWLLFQQARDQTKDNMGEAVRLYQELLVKHGLKLIPVSRNTQDHFASVRSRVLAELLTNKDLLERYRLIESAEAQRLFQEGQLSLLAQTRTWTEPGLDALLLLGPSYLEASQFYSALHRLTEALRHPDLNSESEIGCWHMIGIASHFLGDADTVAKARQRLSTIEGGSQPRLAHLRQMIVSGKGPVSIRGISTLDRPVAESLQSLIAEDIWSIDLADSLLNRRYRKDPNDPSLGRDAREQRKRRGIMNTASPTIAGERVYINEGHTIRAFDRFTGQPAWDQPYSDVETTDREDTNKDQTYDMNIVTIKNDRLVTLTGHLMVRGRSGKGKVVCLDATSGEPLWIRDISHIDESDEFERMFPYGAPIIEDGMVFFLARKVRKQQLTACYVIALDLETGNTRWIRHINTSGGRRGTARPFSTLVSDRGSLYLASPLGAIARIERHDGEIRWLRRYSVPIDNSPNNLHMPWEFDQPILLNNTLIAILPNRRRVVVLDLATGDDLESYPCTSRDGWSAPKYLLGNEHTIYAVGRNVVAFHRDDLSVPVWRLTPPTTESIDGNSFLEQRPEIRGRIQLTQDSLIVPSLYGILVVDDATEAVIDSNVVAQTLFGYSAEEFSGKPYKSLGSPGQFESQPLVRPPAEPGGEVRIERQFQTKDGRGFLGEAKAIHAPSGTTFVIIRDITEERATTRALRDRDARLLVLIEESDDAVLMIDERLNIVEFNKATVDLLGFDPDELYNLSYRSVFDAAAWEEFVEQSARAKDGETVSGLRELIRKDGQVINVDARTKALPDGGSLVVLRDITEKLRLEEQLQQAQRMELIGQLAGGVAHEFNNLLTVINGYAEMTLPLVAENPEALRNVQDIHLAGLNAAKLTEQLLDIGQRQMVASRELNLNAFLEDLADMLRHAIGPAVELALELGRSVPSVVADAVQLAHAVVSLAANARDAMPDGGRLLIQTRSEIDSTGRTTALIAVRDNGVGMDEQVQRRVFDPFFTTKDQGQGIGLGRATTYGIITQAGGSIEVESAPGEGSTFTITLPAAERSPASERS